MMIKHLSSNNNYVGCGGTDLYSNRKNYQWGRTVVIWLFCAEKSLVCYKYCYMYNEL